MNEITITAKSLLWLSGAVISIGGAGAVIGKVFKPKNDLKTRVDKHDILLDNDNKRINELETLTKLQLRSTVAILDHEITGNSIDKLKHAKTEIQEYLIER